MDNKTKTRARNAKTNAFYLETLCPGVGSWCNKSKKMVQLFNMNKWHHLNKYNMSNEGCVGDIISTVFVPRVFPKYLKVQHINILPWIIRPKQGLEMQKPTLFI